MFTLILIVIARAQVVELLTSSGWKVKTEAQVSTMDGILITPCPALSPSHR